MIDNKDILIIDGSEWYQDHSTKKYQLIIVTLDRNFISPVDLFMLAASRLYHGGSFVVRLQSGVFYEDLITTSSLFDFSFINPNSSALNDQFSFQFNGRQTKLGNEISTAEFHANSCINLFRVAFGTDITRRFWNWKYPKDRKVHSTVVLKGGNVIAHYGFHDRSAVYNSEPISASQACDIMVSPEDRGAISNSVFFELALMAEKPFYAKGASFSFIYGFPHGRHTKLGVRLKLYTPVSPIWALSFTIPESATEEVQPQSIVSSTLGNASTKAKIHKALKEMNSAENTLLFKRDFQYLLERYVYHPEFQYQIYYYENSYFILKRSGNRLNLMDYWGALDCYAQRLASFVHYLSPKYPGYKLHLWCLEDILSSFIEPAQVVNTGAYFVYNKYDSELPDITKWWITMGDTEFL